MQLENLVKNVKYHVVDSTAMLAATHPIFSAFETMVAGMSNEVSINSRAYISGLTYAGLGYLVSRGRDISRWLFNISQKSREKTQSIHDSLYLSAINIPISLGLYTAAGEPDIKKIALGTGVSSLFCLFIGSGIGYSIDSFRDLTDLKKCERRLYPKFIGELKPLAKKSLAGLLAITSVGAMALIYSINGN